MKKPHPHAAIIHQWADGATIQFRHDSTYSWVEVTDPAWSDRTEYRVKPVNVNVSILDGIATLPSGETVDLVWIQAYIGSLNYKLHEELARITGIDDAKAWVEKRP